MWKRILLAIALMACSTSVYALERVNVWAEYGGKKISVAGFQSTTPAQVSYPGATVNVYTTGTTTAVSIYDDSAGTQVKANPFTASTTDASAPFYVADGTYDIKFTCTAPNCTVEAGVTWTLTGVTVGGESSPEQQGSAASPITNSTISNPFRWYLRYDDSAPTSGAGIINNWLAPMFRLDLYTDPGTATGSHTGLLIYMPDVYGKTWTTTTQAITGGVGSQTVTVADSSVFAANDSAVIEFGQSGSETVTITAVPGATQITANFLSNHSNGVKIAALGKGDKIAYATSVFAQASNTNNIFGSNFNVGTKSGAYHAVVGNETDVWNQSASAPGWFGGTTPYIIGQSIVCAGGTNDCTVGIGVGSGASTQRFQTGIESGGAERVGIAVTNNGAGAPTTGISVAAAGTYGVIIGANQTAPSDPNFPLSNPTYGVFLTSTGTGASSDSNLMTWQYRTGSANHIWDVRAASDTLLKFYEDSVWTGNALDPTLGFLSQTEFSLRNSSANAYTTRLANCSGATPACTFLQGGGSAHDFRIYPSNGGAGTNGTFSIRNNTTDDVVHASLDTNTNLMTVPRLGTTVADGAAPTAACTGCGATGTVSLGTGSNDSNGVMNIAVAGGGPAANGTATLTFNATLGTNTPVCVAMLGDGTDVWNARATVQRSGGGANTAYIFKWDNNAVALTAGQTYAILYHCIAK